MLRAQLKCAEMQEIGGKANPGQNNDNALEDRSGKAMTSYETNMLL